ncbi:MAG: O-antigen ligase family protein, partial [Lachnospiraceae bacterium]|nr:O-antigen ligase family protein [Lachnospiraceae bacterium]
PEFSDLCLLFPAFLLTIIYPFVIKYVEYDCGFGIYDWHGDIALQQDLYCAGRSQVLIMAGFLIALILIILLIKTVIRRRLQSLRAYAFPILTGGLLIIWMILSTAHSIDKTASVNGNYFSFQGIFVQITYVLLIAYCAVLQSREKSRQLFWKLLKLSMLVEYCIGFLELLHIDPIRWPFVQALILGEYRQLMGGLSTPFSESYIALSFMNPNHAGVYLSMTAGMCLAVFLFSEIKKERMISAGLFAAGTFLLFFTYSRGAQLSFGIVCICLFFLAMKKKSGSKKTMFIVLSVVILLMVILVGADLVTHGRFSRHLLDEAANTGLEEMYADGEWIHILYEDVEYEIKCEGGHFSADPNCPAKITDEMELDGNPAVLLEIDGMEFAFVYDGDYYFYITGNGKVTTLDRIEHVSAFGLEHLGSGRVYIWSRVIPRIRRYWIFGSGFDTFPIAFAQDDYVGKAIYSKDPDMIIENAHSMYLGMIMNIGLPGAVLALLLIVFGVWNIDKTKDKNDVFALVTLTGIVIYLIAGLFYDGNLFVTPIFAMLLGVRIQRIKGDAMSGIKD